MDNSYSYVRHRQREDYADAERERRAKSRLLVTKVCLECGAAFTLEVEVDPSGRLNRRPEPKYCPAHSGAKAS